MVFFINEIFPFYVIFEIFIWNIFAYSGVLQNIFSWYFVRVSYIVSGIKFW